MNWEQALACADALVLAGQDGDGRVSRQEFDGPASRFDRLDRNHDGCLTEEEAPQGSPPERR